MGAAQQDAPGAARGGGRGRRSARRFLVVPERLRPAARCFPVRPAEHLRVRHAVRLRQPPRVPLGGCARGRFLPSAGRGEDVRSPVVRRARRGEGVVRHRAGRAGDARDDEIRQDERDEGVVGRHVLAFAGGGRAGARAGGQKGRLTIERVRRTRQSRARHGQKSRRTRRREPARHRASGGRDRRVQVRGAERGGGQRRGSRPIARRAGCAGCAGCLGERKRRKKRQGIISL